MKTFTVLLAGLLPTYVIRFSLLGIPTNLFEISVIAACIAATWNKKFRGEVILALRALPRGFLLFACVFLLSAVVSTWHSPVLLSSLGILKGWIIVPMLFGLLVHVVDPKKVIHSLIISGLVVALLGISQIDGFTRIRSIYDVPNSLALFLVPVFFMAFWVGVQQKNRFYQCASLVMLISIIWTQSFGALLAIIGTFVIAWVLKQRLTSPNPSFVRRGNARSLPLTKGELEGVGMRNTIFTFFLLSILTISLFTLSGRIQYLISPFLHPNATNSATVRLQLWDIGIRLIAQHPLLGIGLGQFEPAYQAELHRLFASQEKGLSSTVYRLQPEFVFRDPHNWIISFWLNLGLLGLVSFIGLNILALSFRPRDKNPGRQAVTLALISMLIFGLVDTVYWKNDLSAFWWLLVITIYDQPATNNHH